jgi:transcriptional regulator with XRE-family HTH domain
MGRPAYKGSCATALAVDAHFGRQLLRRRRVLGLTQVQVAEAIGVRFQQIHKYECAATRMSGVRLWELAQALGVPVSYFFEGLATVRIAA